MRSQKKKTESYILEKIIASQDILLVFIRNWFTYPPSPVNSENGFLLQPRTVRREIGLVKKHQQFIAAQIYSFFLSGTCPKNVVAE